MGTTFVVAGELLIVGLGLSIVKIELGTTFVVAGELLIVGLGLLKPHMILGSRGRHKIHDHSKSALLQRVREALPVFHGAILLLYLLKIVGRQNRCEVDRANPKPDQV